MSAPGVGVHPDLPNTLVHFTGRPRASNDVPPDFTDERTGDLIRKIAKASVSFSTHHVEGTAATADPAEERLISILMMGQLKGAQVFRSSHPVICFSESSDSARRVMLRDGVVANRGPYAPWGLMLHRDALIELGARPVLYLSAEEFEATAQLPVKLRNRRVRYDPGQADWLHEREWRMCFDDGEQPAIDITPELIAGVIVGRSGWTPPMLTVRTATNLVSGGRVEYVRWSGYADGLARWWWNGDDLVPDGVIELGRPDDGNGGGARYEVRFTA